MCNEVFENIFDLESFSFLKNNYTILYFIRRKGRVYYMLIDCIILKYNYSAPNFPNNKAGKGKKQQIASKILAACNFLKI